MQAALISLFLLSTSALGEEAKTFPSWAAFVEIKDGKARFEVLRH